MAEKLIYLTAIEPIHIYGINDTKLTKIKMLFPKLKIVARDDIVKVIGEEAEIADFERRLNLLVEHYNKYNRLTEEDLTLLLSDDVEKLTKSISKIDDHLLFGNNGRSIKARNDSQHDMLAAFAKNDLIFATGPAGTGKTYFAIALAVRALRNKEVRKIILSRPAVEAGEQLGFLPGDLKEKLDPYMQALYDALFDLVPPKKLADYFEDNIIQIAPLAFMRGRTLSNAVVILDEAQNTSTSQIKMFLTRMGENSKFIITGDLTQIDLPKKQKSGLVESLKLLKNVPGISSIHFKSTEIVRHKLVRKIVQAYESES